MEKAFYIKDSIENKISYYHLLFFLFALPFDRFYSTIILISFLIHTAIVFNRGQWQNINGSVAILQSVFFVSVVSGLYAPSISDGLDVITKQLAIFIFPLLFAFTSLDLARYRSRLLSGLSICCTLTVLYLYFYAIYLIRLNHLPLHTLFSWAFVNHNFSLPIDMHATYLSMLLVLSIAHCLHQLLDKVQGTARVFFMVSACILFGGLVQLSSKSALIAFLIIIIFIFPWFIIEKKTRFRFIFFSLVGSAVMLTSILSFPVFRERYLVMLKDDLVGNQNVVEVNGRFDRWTIAGSLIRKSPFFGTGTGSEFPLLREEYFNRKMYTSYLDSLNAHNQYLSFLINSGIVGLAVYLATLAWGMRVAIKERDLMLLAFIVLISIVSISEDLLLVNKGIYIYGFFFSFLVGSISRPSRKTRWPARNLHRRLTYYI